MKPSLAIVLRVTQDLTALANRRMVVVTGKGGAGKSNLSLAIAHRLAKLGKLVWLVEMGRKRDREFTRLPELLGVSKLGHEKSEITLPGTQEKILASVLDPAQSLAEYVDLKLPTGGLAGVLLNNKVTASFLEVVPGLPDLVQLGKLWHSLTAEKNAPDVVVLDAPATGHAISLLKSPENFKKITRMGPIYRDSSLMADFFSDANSTALIFAALPEEMAVQETLELQKLLGKSFPKPYVLVNKCFPLLPKAKCNDSTVDRAYRYAFERAKREHEAATNLPGAKLLPFFFPAPGAPPLFLQMSEHLA